MALREAMIDRREEDEASM